MSKATCSVFECAKPVKSRGWCQMHYTRWQRHGDPLAAKQIQGDDLARLMSYVLKQPNGCWEWTGSITPKGYGELRWNGRAQRAHRVAYALLKGALFRGLTIDHLCRNRACVNPDHLEQVEHRVNLLRGQTITARNAAVTHCPQGHDYSPENTYTPPTGGRHCRICRAEARRRTYLKLGR